MKKILVETSARHIHLTQETLELLCGKGAKLEVKAMLSQPGQFVSFTKLDLVGPKKSIAGVSILGGDVTIGNRVTIGSNVFLTESIPDDMLVTIGKPELVLQKRK